MIRDNGGWECFNMIEIEKFSCTNKREAEAEEDKVMRELKATMNMIRAFLRPEDVIEDRSFPMEFGLNYLHAISYTKGCYVGQEVIARSKTRGVIHKAIHKVQSINEQPLPPQGTAVMLGEAEIGVLRTTEGSEGLAILRIEEATQSGLSAGGIPLIAALPDWFLLPTPAMKGL
jgi:folate-binding protein YgfZ